MPASIRSWTETRYEVDCGECLDIDLAQLTNRSIPHEESIRAHDQRFKGLDHSTTSKQEAEAWLAQHNERYHGVVSPAHVSS